MLSNEERSLKALLKPLDEAPIQAYLSNRIQVSDLLDMEDDE